MEGIPTQGHFGNKLFLKEKGDSFAPRQRQLMDDESLLAKLRCDFTSSLFSSPD